MRKLDRYIFFRLLTITLFVLVVLICVFILIDFSENSDDFSDQGATIAQIWNEYYINYIPEMVRLVSPVAIFVACLFLTGQMTERLEITAIKASGISLYRLAAPYMLFGLSLAAIISYLDAYVIPTSNAERILFEQEYLGTGNDKIDNGGLYRQESPNTIFSVNHFDSNSNVGYSFTLVEFSADREIRRIVTANRLGWVDSLQTWKAERYKERTFTEEGYVDSTNREQLVDVNVLPRDLARRTSDIYQLTYPEAVNYIESIQRVGAGDINLPLVQLYNRIAYPVSILVVSLIGFALASERRKGGKGFYITAGLVISFVYLVLMKVAEPFGAAGTLDPVYAAGLPHLLFLLIGIILLLNTKK
ncbi:MAG: LptF/LptG family permease [Balneolaceae bacterium]